MSSSDNYVFSPLAAGCEETGLNLSSHFWDITVMPCMTFSFSFIKKLLEEEEKKQYRVMEGVDTAKHGSTPILGITLNLTVPC